MAAESDEIENDVLKTIQQKRKRRREQEKNVDWYSWLLSDYPFLVLFLCTCIIAGCVVVSLLYVERPDFSKPSKGFEVRGTALSDQVVTWKNLYDNTGYNQTLATYPILYAKQRAEAQEFFDRAQRKKQRKNKNKKKRNKNTHQRQKRSISPYQWDFTENGYFCHNPKPAYARIIVESTDQSSLWSVKGLLDICKAEKTLLSHVTYSDVCIHAASTFKDRQPRRNVASSCCPTLSVSNYVAFFAKVSSCEKITEADLEMASSLLMECAPFYANGSLTNHCWSRGKGKEVEDMNLCPDVPSHCTKYDAVFSIFHYLTDKNFLSSVLKNTKDPKFQLKYSAVFLPAMRNKDLLTMYYDNFIPQKLHSNLTVHVGGIDFGLKDLVFDQALQKDMRYPIAAMAAVMFIIILYTKSVFVTIMSILASVSSLFMSFFLYTVIFEFSHFPFMNLTAIMVMVGIGADNVFVYSSAWKTYKEQDNRDGGIFVKKRQISAKLSDSRIGVVTKVTLKHAARSMFVTGVTTAFAFLANFASTVTAIKCFGIYTGFTVLMNLFLCVTWLPAAIVVHEKYFSGAYTKFFNIFKKQSTNTFCFVFKYLKCFHSLKKCFCCKFFKCLKDCSRVFFHKIQIYIIVKLRWFWLCIGMAVAAGGCFAIFVNPKLRLPTESSYFQYFKSSHHFERYTLSLSDKFAFENEGNGYMPVTLIFGVVATDNGNPMDPDNRGDLVFSPSFNMSDTKSQIWLKEFCRKIRKKSFYKSYGDEYDFRMCFIEPFEKWMNSIKCMTENNIDNSPCCKDTRFPYSPPVFDKCLKKAVLKLTNTPGISLDRLTPGPRFDANDTLRVVIVEFQSTQPYTGSYQDIATFYKEIETWLKKELDEAPPGLKHDAWFRSDLEFHALQLGLYQGTVTAIGLSMAVVCVALILTTCSLTITILANITIAFTIFMTVGVLVVAGWELNILESITISIAIGLSVDFTVHYAVAYLMAPSSDRIEKVEHSASSMGPAIALAALTTFIAGLCMLPAQVDAYYKFGVFLMLIMITSWFYGTYFFQAFCGVIGPQGTQRQSAKCICCCVDCKDDHKMNGRGIIGSQSETSTVTKSSKICSNRKRASSDSPSATMIEMSSCASALN